MGAYNAALPIIEAFSRGVQAREAVENRKLREEQLRAQIEMERQKHEERMKLEEEKFKLQKSVETIRNYERISNLVSSGKVQPPRYEAPIGAVPGTQQAQFGMMQTPAVAPGGTLEAPPVTQTPIMGAVPEMQTESRIQPGTELMGVDLSNIASPEQLAQQKISEEMKMIQARNEANAPLRAEDRAFKTGERVAGQEFRKELQNDKQAFDEAVLDKNLKVKEAYNNEMIKLRKEMQSSTNEYRKAQLGIQQQRLQNQAAKLAQSGEKEEADISQYKDDILTGALTQEAIVKMAPKLRTKFMDFARKSNISILKEKQLADLGDLKVVQEFQRGVRELREKIENAPRTAAFDVGFQAELSQAQNRLKAMLEPIAKGIGYKGVITDKEQARLESLIPSYYTLNQKDRNQKAEEALGRFIENKYNTILPPSQFSSVERELQRENILNAYGFIAKKSDVELPEKK